MFQKCSNLKNSNQLSGDEYTVGSVIDRTNSTKTRKHSNFFLGIDIEARKSCLMKKTSDGKSLDTAPLIYLARQFAIPLTYIRDLINIFLFFTIQHMLLHRFARSLFVLQALNNKNNDDNYKNSETYEADVNRYVHEMYCKQLCKRVA